MILTCPSCDTRYQLKRALAPEGRPVKCSACGHNWIARPDDDKNHIASFDPPPPVDPLPNAVDVTETTPTGDIAAAFEPAARAPDIDWNDDDAVPDFAAAKGSTDGDPGGPAGTRAADADLPDAAFSDGAPESGARMVEDAGWDQSAFDDGGDNDAAAGDSIEQAAQRRAWRAFGRNGPKRAGGAGPVFDRLKPVMIGGLAAMLVAMVAYREDVVRAVPSSAGLFAMVGLDVNLFGLAFDDIVTRQNIENGVPVLRIDGLVRNVADEAVPVPPIRLALTGPSAEELYFWTVSTEHDMLEPGAEIGFSTRLAAPPNGARNLEVTFSDTDDLMAGLR